MSFMYPRTISITRPAEADAPSLSPRYSSLSDPETVVADGIAANIQLDRQGRDNPVGLPSDVKVTMWRVFFKGALGLLQERDVIIDDLGLRYKVIAPYWNSLGYNALCDRLDV